jgi:hypothetical protein
MNLCGKPAVVKVLWPTGKQVHCCDECCRGLNRVAQCLGMSLVVVEPDDPERTCEQKIQLTRAQERAAEATPPEDEAP